MDKLKVQQLNFWEYSRFEMELLNPKLPSDIQFRGRSSQWKTAEVPEHFSSS